MKPRILVLACLLALGTSVSAIAQTDQQKPQTSDQTQAQPQAQPANGQNQTQPAADQTQTPVTTDQASQDAGQDKSAEKSDKDKKKNKHDGSKNDVDSIGNRKVGGLDWYSIEREIRMGKSYAMQIEQSMKMVQDPVVNEYVNRIGQNLVRNSDAKVPFTIKVVDADEINAMALPGGFFYVNSGLILAV
jgi:beta-barrel assembly-enhancing protease